MNHSIPSAARQLPKVTTLTEPDTDRPAAPSLTPCRNALRDVSNLISTPLVVRQRSKSKQGCSSGQIR